MGRHSTQAPVQPDGAQGVRYHPTVYGAAIPEDKAVKKGKWIAILAAGAIIGAAAGTAAARPGPLRPEAPKVTFMAGLAGDKTPEPVLGVGPAAPEQTAAAVTAALAKAMADPRLGGHATASVVDLTTGAKLFDKSGEVAATPASTLKLFTGAAVLAARGPGYRIETKVVAGAQPGEVYVLGAGDPTLTAATKGSYPEGAKLTDLAAQVKAALGGQAPTKLYVDGSLYSGPAVSPNWLPEDVTGLACVSLITAFATDGARTAPTPEHCVARQGDPELAAAVQFAGLLGLPAGAVAKGQAPAGAKELGKVQSPPIARLVEIALTESDNVIAEALARQVAVAKGKPASFDGAAEAMRETLVGLGVTPPESLADGSGMAAKNKVSPDALTGLLQAAAKPEHPELRTLFTGMPVAGFTGTLNDRYGVTSDGAGLVRAKTGTLTGVDTLAGVVVTKSGRVLAFAVMAAGAPNSGQAREALDLFAVSLVRCGCTG